MAAHQWRKMMCVIMTDDNLSAPRIHQFTYWLIWLLLRLAHAALGAHAETKTCYQRALELEPSNDMYRENLRQCEQLIRDENVSSSTTVASVAVSEVLSYLLLFWVFNFMAVWACEAEDVQYRRSVVFSWELCWHWVYQRSWHYSMLSLNLLLCQCQCLSNSQKILHYMWKWQHCKRAHFFVTLPGKCIIFLGKNKLQVMTNCNWSTVQWLSQNLRMPLAPGGVSPLHRTGNASKVFCFAAVGKTCTLLTNPLHCVSKKCTNFETV